MSSSIQDQSVKKPQLGRRVDDPPLLSLGAQFSTNRPKTQAYFRNLFIDDVRRNLQHVFADFTQTQNPINILNSRKYYKPIFLKTLELRVQPSPIPIDCRMFSDCQHLETLALSAEGSPINGIKTQIYNAEWLSPGLKVVRFSNILIDGKNASDLISGPNIRLVELCDIGQRGRLGLPYSEFAKAIEKKTIDRFYLSHAFNEKGLHHYFSKESVTAKMKDSLKALLELDNNSKYIEFRLENFFGRMRYHICEATGEAIPSEYLHEKARDNICSTFKYPLKWSEALQKGAKSLVVADSKTWVPKPPPECTTPISKFTNCESEEELDSDTEDYYSVDSNGELIITREDEEEIAQFYPKDHLKLRNNPKLLIIRGNPHAERLQLEAEARDMEKFKQAAGEVDGSNDMDTLLTTPEQALVENSPPSEVCMDSQLLDDTAAQGDELLVEDQSKFCNEAMDEEDGHGGPDYVPPT